MDEVEEERGERKEGLRLRPSMTQPASQLPLCTALMELKMLAVW